MKELNTRLRALPSVHEVLVRLESMEEFAGALENQGTRRRLTEDIRQILQDFREKYLSEDSVLDAQAYDDQREGLWDRLLEKLRQADNSRTTSLRRVINATGVVLHTNCGRALLSAEVAAFVAEIAQRYSNLELNLETGERGSRYVHVEKLLCRLTGAEAAMVVNNNAAAVLLVMNTLAQGKEVIVSRGELVEVGGSFRIPEVLKAGGAQLVEVGSTNKTWLKDYEEAITADTALILKVHQSNFRIEGFTQAVSGRELTELGRKYSLPVVEDLGSGSFIDGITLGFQPEPTIDRTVKEGLSLVTFSGDKLLGGPQAGIIVGKQGLIERLRKNQLTRALRIDKLTLAALEATLWLYAEEKTEDIPIWKMMYKNETQCHTEAVWLQEHLQAWPGGNTEVQSNHSQVGGGAWPTEKLPTWVCAVRPSQGSLAKFEKFLRDGAVPILARIQKDWVLLDPRTFLEGDREEIVARIQQWNFDGLA